MTLKSDAKFEEKRTLGSKTDMVNFMRVVTILKIFFLIWYVCATTPKNDTIFEEELTWALKNDMKNLANFDSTLKSLKSFG